MLNWANQFNICCLLDNQQYQQPHNSFECLLAADTLEMVSSPAELALDLLGGMIDPGKDWWFGHLSYDLKNELEPLTSEHEDNIGFPDLFFFHEQFQNEHEEGYIF